jgi:glycosyltransferase involved in cell wall biosynthesis
MKILQICNKSPYPPKEGGPIAMHNIAYGLMRNGHTVHILTVNTPKYFIDVDFIPADYSSKTNFSAVYIDTRTKIWPAFLNFFSKKSYHVTRFINENFREKLKEILKENSYDVVQLETVYMAPYITLIRELSKAKIVLRAHNVEFLIWERLSRYSTNFLKKWYVGYLAKKLKKYELQMLNTYDGIAAITKIDADYLKALGCKIPITVIPFGIDISDYVMKPVNEEKISLFHLGSMDWFPNQEGIKWFVDNCWGKIVSDFPDIKLYLGGRNMPEWLLETGLKNVITLSCVEDGHAFISAHTIMIVPLLSGSGVRIKIIEGMALGKTIISTTIGAEGINCENGVNIMIADTPEDFYSTVKILLGDVDKIREIGESARKNIENEYDIDKTTQKLVGFYNIL